MGDDTAKAGWMKTTFGVAAAPPGGAAPGGAPGGGAPAVWTPPFELTASDSSEMASENLLHIKNKLQDFKAIGFEQEMALVEGALVRQMNATSGANRLLTAQEVQTLTVVGAMAVQVTQDTMRAFVGLLSAELDKYQEVGAARADAAAELIHQQFRKGDAANSIADLKEIVSKTKEVTESVKGYVDDAKKTKAVIKAAAKLEDVSKAIEGFTKKLGTAIKALDVMSDVATLAGKVSQKPSQAANDIGRMKAGFNVVGFVLSKSNIPLLGDYWEHYLKPCTEKCFEMIQKLDDMLDSGTRQNMADEWWSHASKGMAAPSITDSGLVGVMLAKTFPAGQPMLDFMWSFFRGAPPASAPSAVLHEFMKFRKVYNAGLPEEQQLKTDASWKNLWDLGQDEDSPNIMAWVAANKETVWAMHYGSLPHP